MEKLKKWLKNEIFIIKYNINNLKSIINDLKVIKSSPLKPPKIKYYIGNLHYGVPYYYPPKISLRIWDLGWKTKWSEHDYRYEFKPGLSIRLFNLQFCIMLDVNHLTSSDNIVIEDSYWETFLHWKYNTDNNKDIISRTKELINRHSNTWSTHNEQLIDYYEFILKNELKFLIDE